MDVSISQEGGISVIRLNGRLDSCASDDFGQRLDSALNLGAAALLLDCTQLSFISSAGLRVLLLAIKRIQADGGRLAMCSLSDNVREVFVISGLTKVFSIHANYDDAVLGLAQPDVTA